jgi:hypothetical protein
MEKTRKIAIGALVIFALVILMQLVPVTRKNYPVGGDFDGQEDVARILRRSCYNCHSNETSWPWYSWVAPASWLVTHDVNEAREHLNFSNWKAMRPDDQELAKKEIWQEIKRGDMPPGTYLIMHSVAKLSENEKSLIRSWAVSGRDSINVTETAEGN